MGSGVMSSGTTKGMPPALRGMISNAIKRWWPTLTVHPETNLRDSPLIIVWRGISYRLYVEQVQEV